jgi:soluble lytic murein transglycosylase
MCGSSVARIILLILFLTVDLPALADIYRYVDKKGVRHFTNIKTKSQYRLFIRTARKKPQGYIKAYEGIIKQAATRFGVDPCLIKAVIKAESGFDNHSVSHKGAKGLMQLMPHTANDMEVTNPFDPKENIFGGTRYLSLMLKRFNHDKELALSAYNAGPTQVETYRGIPPFPETRAFIKKVLSYYKAYQANAGQK